MVTLVKWQREKRRTKKWSLVKVDDLPPADVRHPVTPNLEIAQILTEGEAFDDAADFGVYFLGCAKRRGTVDLGVHARISTYHSLHW